MQEGLRGEPGDDGIVDLKKSACPFLALPQCLFRLFSLRDIFGQRHEESRYALGSRNKRDIVPYPDQTAILTSILLFDLELFSLSLQQLGGKRPIGFPVVLV